MTKKVITSKYIEELSYTDFVGLINQWNVLPGSYSTLSKWLKYSFLNKNSKLLEIACTTGFSSRELAFMSGCSGEGFDLSERSIEMAKYNKSKYAPSIDFSYFVADGYKYKPKNKFTHVVVGASLGFFPDPKNMLNKCINTLKDNGYILASPFYVRKKIPASLMNRARDIFGIYPTCISYKEIMKLYNSLEIIFEERNNLIKETKEEIDFYCKSTIDRACKILDIKDHDIYNSMYSRLYKIKKMSNDLRPYQMYSVLVLRFRSRVFPNRFVELF